MLPDRVSNPGPLTYESGALPIALRGPASSVKNKDKFTRAQAGSAQISSALSREDQVTLI